MAHCAEGGWWWTVDLTNTELGYELAATSGKLLNHVMILDQLQMTTHTFN